MVTHKPSSRQSDLTPLFNPTSSNPRNGDLVPQRVFGFAVTALAQALLAHRPPEDDVRGGRVGAWLRMCNVYPALP